jgi:hypothetical protein
LKVNHRDQAFKWDEDDEKSAQDFLNNKGRKKAKVTQSNQTKY